MEAGVYVGETGENMHTRMKSHLTKYNSKKQDISSTNISKMPMGEHLRENILKNFLMLK